MVNILLSLLIVAIMLFFLIKKFNMHTTLLMLAVAILLIHAAVTGESILGEDTQGNIFLDIFQFVADTFVSAFRTSGILIMTIVGYSTYMRKIKASDRLASLLVKPLSRLNKPYLLIVLTIIISEIVHIAIPSGTGTVAVMLAAIYPILRASGVSKINAAAALVLGTGIDFGPAPANIILYTSFVGEGVTGVDMFRVQFGVYPISILVLGVVGAVTYWFIDKRNKKAGKIDKYEGEDAEAEIDTEGLTKVPIFYAIFPLLPVVFAIVFSDLVIQSITMTVPGAVFLSFLLVLVIHIIVTRKPKESFATTKSLYESGGKQWTGVVSLISIATVFGAAIEGVGGLELIADALAVSGLPFFVTMVAFGLLAILLVFITTSSSAALATLSPTFVAICRSFNIDPLAGGIGYVTSSTMSRTISPLNGANLLVSGTLNIDALDMVKRNVFPAIFISMFTCVLAQLVFGF